MKRSERSSLIQAVLLGSFALIGGTGLTISSAWLITMASEHPPIMVLGVSIVLVRFFGIFRSVARYLERVLSHEAIFRKLTALRVKLFASIASRRRSTSISTSVKLVIDDVERAQEFFLRITLPQYAAGLSGAATLVLALWINLSTFLILTFSTAILAILIPFLVRKYLDPISTEIEDQEQLFAQAISDAAHAVVEAEVFGYGAQYRTQLIQSSSDLRSQEDRFIARVSRLQFLLSLTLGSAITAVALSAYRSDTVLPIHVSMAIFLALIGFEGYTSWFPNLFTAGKIRRAAQHITEIAALPSEHDESLRIVPERFNLECREVSPYWDEPFLAPISFALEEGQTLVIHGASGVGKSTLAAALLRLSHFQGEITVGGISIKDLDPTIITGTLQGGHIFNTTLRENLKLASPSIGDEELRRILALVELDGLPLDEILGEFGRVLSGGEAKRLAIARALLSPAKIVILDEPLEHIDHERSLRLQSAIMQECQGRTLIVITHSPWLQYSRKLELTRE